MAKKKIIKSSKDLFDLKFKIAWQGESHPNHKNNKRYKQKQRKLRQEGLGYKMFLIKYKIRLGIRWFFRKINVVGQIKNYLQTQRWMWVKAGELAVRFEKEYLPKVYKYGLRKANIPDLDHVLKDLPNGYRLSFSRWTEGGCEQLLEIDKYSFDSWESLIKEIDQIDEGYINGNDQFTIDLIKE